MTILIPSYEPNKNLLWLIEKIKTLCSFNIVVVDDGSGNAYSDIFKSIKEYGCTVLAHKTNQGKGSALKTGFMYIKGIDESEGIVCADSDGQHLPEDIIKVAGKIKEYKNNIILGCRRFTGKVPIRSRFGNAITRMVFSFCTGLRIYDTQTGLRGYSPDMIDWLCSVPGERFEYEINILLEANAAGYSFHEMDISTVYNNNKSSHFRTFVDSARVYLPLLKFSASSLVSAVLDFTLLIVIQWFTSNLLIAVVGARVCSSLLNYTMNKTLVFSKSKGSEVKKSMPKYFTLVAVVLALNYALIYIYSEWIGIPLFFAKLLTEATIYLFSYWSQRKFVFRSEVA